MARLVDHQVAAGLATPAGQARARVRLGKLDCMLSFAPPTLQSSALLHCMGHRRAPQRAAVGMMRRGRRQRGDADGVQWLRIRTRTTSRHRERPPGLLGATAMRRCAKRAPPNPRRPAPTKARARWTMKSARPLAPLRACSARRRESPANVRRCLSRTRASAHELLTKRSWPPSPPGQALR